MKYFDDGSFIGLNLDIALRFYQYFTFAFYIKKKNGELVEISSQTKNLLHTFEGYKQRGPKEIFLTTEDYEKFSDSLREVLALKEELKDSFNDIGLIYDQVRAKLLSIGMNGYDIMIANELNKATIKKVQDIPNLSKLLSDYKSRCSEEFFGYVMMSFILCRLIDSFPWTSNQIKTKATLAAFFCDIYLKPEDYHTMISSEGHADLPIHIKNHPIESANILYKADPSTPHEVIQMIELHHESQEGNGYPGKIGHGNIPLLPSIFIVARMLMEELMRNPSLSDLDPVFEKIYKAADKGLLKKASMAMFKVFSASSIGCRMQSDDSTLKFLVAVKGNICVVSCMYDVSPPLDKLEAILMEEDSDICVFQLQGSRQCDG